MARLNDVFNDILGIDDNTFVIRIINTILSTDDQETIRKNFIYFTELINFLTEQFPDKRPSIVGVIKQIKNYIDTPTKKEYLRMIKEHIDRSKDDYKNLYVLCFCRSVFECNYTNSVMYTHPKYACDEASGLKSSWQVFTDAVKHDNAII